jgi:hypothetical protein
MSKRGSYIGGGSVIYPSRGNPESFLMSRAPRQRGKQSKRAKRNGRGRK